jgi:hypothetical protein
MSFLPPELQAYSSIITIVLLFVDGALFGLAIKKAVISVILIIVGLILASLIGLSIPFISTGDIWMHVINIFMTQAAHIGPIFYGFPIFWIIGFALGIWKG